MVAGNGSLTPICSLSKCYLSSSLTVLLDFNDFLSISKKSNVGHKKTQFFPSNLQSKWKKMWQKLFQMRLCVMQYILALVCLTFAPKLTQGHFQCEQFLMKEVLLPLLRWIIHSGMSNRYFVTKIVLTYYEKKLF